MQRTKVIDERIIQLYHQCDANGLGYVTREDLDRLKFKLSFNEQQLDEVFRLLDKQKNGKVTLENFLSGFDEFMSGDAKVVETSDSNTKADEIEDADGIEDADNSLEKTLAQFDITDILQRYEQIEPLWKELNRTNPELLTDFEKLLHSIFDEIKTATVEYKEMENALQSQLSHQRDQISQSIEDLEKQMWTEKEAHVEKMKESEHALRQQLAKEIEAREKSILELTEKLEEAKTQFEQAMKEQIKIAHEKENLALECQKLEVKLGAVEEELSECRGYVSILKEKAKNDKRKRANAAMELGENTVLEREKLLREIKLLRSLKEKLLSEKSQLNEPPIEPKFSERHPMQSISYPRTDSVDNGKSIGTYLAPSPATLRKGSVLGDYLMERLPSSTDSPVQKSNDSCETEDSTPCESPSPVDEVTSPRLSVITEATALEMKHSLNSVNRETEQTINPIPSNPQRVYKVIFVGESDVGKSSIIHSFMTGTFDSSPKTTISIDFKVTTFNCDDKLVVLQIWDTAGQERYGSLTTHYFRKTDAVIIVFDITNERSFATVRKWLSTVEEKASDDVVVMVVSNKHDQLPNWSADQPVPTASPLMEILKDERLIGHEISAMTGENINLAFTELVRRLIEKEDKKWMEGITLKEERKQDSKKRCCR